jgi:hypothetical protein
MTVTAVVLQSNYLPWKGYFDLIHDADVCVFYDEVQYTKNDWRNRNRIKTAAGPRWISVPAGARIHRRVCDVALRDHRWQEKHWKTLSLAYSAAPHFSRYRDFFADLYLGRTWRTLSDLNQFAIRTIAAEFLGIRARFLDSRDYPTPGARAERLIGLLRRIGAGIYVSGPAARAYLDESACAAAGIEVHWKSYEGYPEYPQPYPPFEHAVSIVDALFCLGPEAGEYIWGWRGRSGQRLPA